ncbi:acyl-CoA synthetase [Janibacter sp. GXQ6167]|uniref:acyl-CoA synthetase n=1 Tax=Janibacter sp. GXQ6167 TaxID=3240791 RepID=UPI0035247172
MPAEYTMARYCVGDPAARRPDHLALIVVHDAHADPADPAAVDQWTYREVDAAVRSIARGLTAPTTEGGLGLHRGDRVMLRMGNRARFPLTFFGAIAAGLVAVPTSAQLTEEEAAWILADSEAAAIALDPDLSVAVPEGIAILTPELIATWIAAGAHDERQRAPFADLHPDDPAFITYTSGTTGRPKGVVHAQRSAWGRRPMYDGWYGLTEDDVMLHAGALNWTYTLGVGLTDPWAVGATALVYDGPREPLVWPHLIAAHRATLFAAVPGVYRHLVRHGDPSTWDLTSLRHGLVAGEALPGSVRAAWEKATNRPLYEALGMSEISTFVSSGPTTPVRPGSPGRAQPGRRIAVLSQDDGTPVPIGEAGRLAVHRSDPGLMLGYWRRPEETADAMRDDWFVTADLVSLDDDGYLTYHGRCDDVMNAMGYRVSPVEVEECLAHHPEVAEVAVTAVPKGEGVAIITAWVVPAASAKVGDAFGQRLIDYAHRHLAAYKCPREVVVVESLPRTGNGKLRRADLR